MRKGVIIFLLGILLIGTNAFAAGDLIVNGQLGVGTATPDPDYRMEINGVNGGSFRAMSDFSNLTDLNSWATNYNLTVSDQSGYSDKIVSGFTAAMVYTGYATKAAATTLTGFANNILLNTQTTGTHGFNAITNAEYRFTVGSLNNRNIAVDDYYGFRHFYNDSGGGTITGNNFYGAHFGTPNGTSFQPTNLYGLFVEKQSSGTSNNYGIVLDGEDAGADIVFGDGGGSYANRPRIYSSGGFLFAANKDGVATQISPHDPETGEWIFYSKNIKTGKVVRVEMEKLVKAVEKLTGETFMVETLIADK